MPVWSFVTSYAIEKHALLYTVTIGHSRIHFVICLFYSTRDFYAIVPDWKRKTKVHTTFLLPCTNQSLIKLSSPSAITVNTITIRHEKKAGVPTTIRPLYWLKLLNFLNIIIVKFILRVFDFWIRRIHNQSKYGLDS